MEGSRREFGRKRFSCGNIFGDPFALATISIALIAWIISFVSSILAVLNATPSDVYPNFSWWTLAYMLIAIIGIMVTVGSDSVYTYHVSIVGFLAAGLTFTTSSVNGLIYSGDAAHEAASAGFILLSMVCIVWIFYYGSQPTAPHRHAIDSFALQKDRAPSRTSRHMPPSTYRPETTISQQPQMYTSAQLSGFETSSPVTGYPGGPAGAQNDPKRQSDARLGPPANLPTGQLSPHAPPAPNSRSATPAQQRPESEAHPAEYPYRAKAIYSYEANPEDANEISFSKHEILEVSDVSGRWWQAKKENGETGIAPSNYLILL